MAYSTERNRITPLAIVSGLALSFTLMGVASAALGSLFFDYKDYIQLASGLIILVMGLTIGLKAYVLIQLPMILIAGPLAVWMFYVQHQFEGVYWERHERWDFTAASLQGSSFYKVPALLAWFIIYYVLGFLVIASLFAAIGSACNSLKEAQALMTPMMMIVVLPMIVWLPIAQNPNGTMALVFSFIPTSAPMVMMVRICSLPEISLVQIMGSLVVLFVSTVVILWAASKIFRTGILMYGKPPTLREMLRWVRAN
jgi:ABC-2 type transport system permease protein